MTTPDFLNSDEQQFASSLQTLVRDEHPDLDGILAGATRIGRRSRMRRRVGVGLAAAACVGAFATAYVVVPGAGHDGGNEQQVTSAVDDHTSIERIGPVTVLRQDGTALAVLGGSSHQQVQALLELHQLPRTKAYAFERDPARLAELKTLFPEIDDWTGAFVVSVVKQGDSAGVDSLRDESPVSVDLAGWTCDWFPIDDKGACNASGATLGVVWRAASERDDFIAKEGASTFTVPMLGGDGMVTDGGTIVGPARNGIFVAVQPGQGSTAQMMADVAGALTWTE